MELARLNVLIGADLSELEKKLKGAAKTLQASGEQMQQVGRAMSTAVTLPLLAIGGASTKAALDFESSFAGIRKTMALTEAEFGRLSDANRQLAKEIPVAVDELNHIGELAGQLGIEGVDNVLKFEDTIAKLAVTTDLTAEQGALAFAQIANIMQLPQDQIDRLGAAVVGLGNNFATTESSIVDFTQRIAGAGKLANLTAGDTAGIATAFSSLGVGAEAGGTAVQKVLLAMVTAVQQGGDQLDAFASTAGLSADGFAHAFRTDAAGAFAQFVAGLGQQGNGAISTLETLGLTDQRLTAAFLSAAGAGDLLSRAITKGNEEFEANTALTNEAAQRFATAESQLTLFWNRLKDVGITLGAALIPVLLSTLDATKPVIDMIGTAAEVFAGLNPSVQVFIVGLAALAAAAGPVILVLGSILTVLPALTAGFAVLWAAITGPVGLVVAAIVGLGVAWAIWGDDVKRIVAETITTVRTWLVDKFNAIVAGVKEKVEAVTGFFRGMYDAVVGHSWVPDMIDGIRDHFARLGPEMVDVTDQFTQYTSRLFDGMADGIADAMTGAKFSVSDFVQSALRDLARLAAKMVAMKIVGAIFAPATGGASIIGAEVLSGISGFAATGANVRSGQSWVVGENGPEIFQPGVSGQVRPIGAGGGMDSGEIAAALRSRARPMTPREAAQDDWWVSFFSEVYQIAGSRGLRLGGA